MHRTSPCVHLRPGRRRFDVGTANILRLRCCLCQHGCIFSAPPRKMMLPMSTPGYNARREMRRAKPYHHGNLREALLGAAIRLIAEVGPTAFTLREVARRAGVSHNAPYRHFRDREDLLAAVAAQGFRELTRAMIEAAAGKSDALERLKCAGLGYVTFALRRPEHFTVMFDAPVSKHKHPDSAAAAE